MLSLPAPVRIHILIGLACFETPETVVTSVKEKFGLTLSRQRVEAHNPERAAGARLGVQWRDLFYDARQRYLKELADIPLAHKA
ncbi:DUF2280 domain-containing protein [Pseudoduganella sp. UC29_106]|uniref:DUF2280 domain-containing protein n=1 Tax=Pseudoduganella sp. UC29_106 TaxID=3374553 RepID=UPI003757D661